MPGTVQRRRWPRGELVTAAVQLHAQHPDWSKAQLAVALGVRPQALRNALADPLGMKQRARRVRYQGRCRVCGGATSGSEGRGANQPRTCWRCARGLPPEPDRRRRVPVRLCDLPLEVRLDGAAEACRHEPDLDARADIVAVALQPPATVYWVAA
jgi:hypothetical protein